MSRCIARFSRASRAPHSSWISEAARSGEPDNPRRSRARAGPGCACANAFDDPSQRQDSGWLAYVDRTRQAILPAGTPGIVSSRDVDDAVNGNNKWFEVAPGVIWSGATVP
jgi:hypothetical protein